MTLTRLTFCICLLSLIGCQKQLEQSPELTSMKSVYEQKNRKLITILPFESLSKHQHTGDDLTLFSYNQLFKELYTHHQGKLGPIALELLDEFKVKDAIKTLKIKHTELKSAENLKLISKQLKLDLILLGKVSQYDLIGNHPSIHLHFRLYETNTETIIWSGSGSTKEIQNTNGIDQQAQALSHKLIKAMLVDLKEQVSQPKI